MTCSIPLMSGCDWYTNHTHREYTWGNQAALCIFFFFPFARIQNFTSGVTFKLMHNIEIGGGRSHFNNIFQAIIFLHIYFLLHVFFTYLYVFFLFLCVFYSFSLNLPISFYSFLASPIFRLNALSLDFKLRLFVYFIYIIILFFSSLSLVLL